MVNFNFKSLPAKNGPYQIKMNNRPPVEQEEEPPAIHLIGRLYARQGKRLMKEVSGRLSAGKREVVIELEGVDRIDSQGGAWLIRADRAARAAGAKLFLRGARGNVSDFIGLIKASFEEPAKPRREKESLLEAAGGQAIAVWGEFADVVRLIVDAIYWSFIAPVEGRGLRWKGFLDELYEMGWRAVGIVGLINFLLGLVIAMLSAVQLRLFGMTILVASLVVIGFARELAVVMTGIVVSARTGGAIAAELATMTVSEEIDALKGMGLNVSRFLVAPKVLAILVAMPILTIIGFITGVAGGFFLGLFSLGFTFDRWWQQTVQALKTGDFMQGLLKSFFFALIIVIVGCHNGLRVTGGARGVGLSTTRSVVMDIFFIVVADMVFASLFYFFT